jgi:hypothetical protein
MIRVLIAGYCMGIRSERRLLQDGQLRDWIAADQGVSGDAVVKIVNAMRVSRLFRKEVERDVLGPALRRELPELFTSRDLPMFNLAIDSKLRGCDVVALKVEDVASS